MRQMISGLAAAIAVMAASSAPAMACGLFGGCGESYAPVPVYSGCNTGCGGGGWAYERLADPVQQYYYADQGPTYTGPGDFAPYPTYQESAVSGWGAYRHHPYYYGYDGGRYANATNHYYDGAPRFGGPAVYSYPRAHTGYRYGYANRYGYASRYGYAHRYGHAWRYGYTSHYSLPPRQFYAPRRSVRYGYYGAPRHYGYGAPHHGYGYGYHERVLRRYY